MSFIKSSKFWSMIALLGSLGCIAAIAYSIFGFRADAIDFRGASSILRNVVKVGAAVFVLSLLVMILGRKNSGAVKTSMLSALLVAVPVIGIALNQPAGTRLASLNPPAFPQAMGGPPAGMGGAAMGAAMGGGEMGAAMGAAMGGGTGRPAPLNDISTDTQNPPLYSAVASLRPEGSNTLEYPGASAARTQAQLFPDIAPIKSSLSSSDAFARALQVGKQMGWDIVANDEAAGHIEGVASTTFFAFKDDVVIRVKPDAAGSVVDIRSHSRIGRGDRGKNAERVREFISKFNG